MIGHTIQIRLVNEKLTELAQTLESYQKKHNATNRPHLRFNKTHKLKTAVFDRK
jgi:hypothetical protein